jgi:hypothetical protein
MFGSVWSVNMANAISRAIHLEGTLISHLLNVAMNDSRSMSALAAMQTKININFLRLFVPYGFLC